MLKPTEKQLKKWRKEAVKLRQRSKWLSKKYGTKIQVLDLNPHETAGRKFPKSALTKSGKRIWDVGHANTRSKTIDIDERLTKRLQHRVIKHEREHLRHPRASEKEIEKITFKKFGFKKLMDKKKRGRR